MRIGWVATCAESITLGIVFALAVPVLPALVGARIAWRLKPPSPASPSAAFD